MATYQHNISQNCWAQHVARVWPSCAHARVQHARTWPNGYDIMQHPQMNEKFDKLQIWAKNTQHVATHRNRVAKSAQHVRPNMHSNVAIVWPPFEATFKVDSLHICNLITGAIRSRGTVQGQHVDTFCLNVYLLSVWRPSDAARSVYSCVVLT